MRDSCAIAGLLLGTLAACSSANVRPGEDAGPAPGTDAAPPPDAGIPFPFPDESILASFLGDYLAADLTCRGMRSRPAGTAPMPYQIHIIRWGGGAAGVTTWFFLADEVRVGDAASCIPPGCTEQIADATGRVQVNGPLDTWFAMRILPFVPPSEPAREVVDNYIFRQSTAHLDAPTPRETGTIAILRSDVDRYAAAYGGVIRRDAAIVAASIYDCAAHTVTGAVLRVFTADGREVLPGTSMGDPHLGYLDADLVPDGTLRTTSDWGQGAMLNVPLPGGPAPIRVEAWGRPATGAPPERLGCEVVLAAPGAISTLLLRPLRADRDPACL